VNAAIKSGEDEGVLSLEETYTPVPQPKRKRRAPRRYWIGALLVLVAVGGIALSILVSMGELRPSGAGLGTAETPTVEETAQAEVVTEAAPSATETSEAEVTETATLTPTEAPSSTSTHTPTPSQTSTPVESAAPTLTPSITPTPVIINTTISAATGTFVNLRTGPGEQYGRVDVLPADETVEVDGKSDDGLWVRLREPLPGVQFAWVAADLVQLSDEQRARLQEVSTNPSIRLGTSGDS
jgi:hypothetical protein